MKNLRRIRRFHRKNKKGKEPGEINYWQSYSDLMAAMVLVFALIIGFTIYRAKEDYENIGREAKEKDWILLKQGQELDRLTGRLKEMEKKMADAQQEEAETDEFLQEYRALAEQNDSLMKQNEELSDSLRELEEKTERVYAIRRDIVEELEEEFSDSDLEVDIDPESGTVCLDSNILFAYDDFRLSNVGKETLDNFFPAYFSVILRNYDSVSEVIIEGHADDRGDYSYNMNLSQARAFAVMNYCIGDEVIDGVGVNDEMFSEDELRVIREIVTVNGRSYYDLIYDDGGNADADASRRVEIKFRLRAENVLLNGE